MCVALWHEIYIEKIAFLDTAAFKAFFAALFISIVFVGGFFHTYFTTVCAIHISKTLIKLKFRLGRTITLKWNQIKYVIIGFKDDTQIWLREGKNTREFHIDRSSIKKIIDYYKQETGRDPISPKKFFDRKER
jgi:hypothetical protein